jgi:tetratricopeptide (TPR) repeat protein
MVHMQKIWLGFVFLIASLALALPSTAAEHPWEADGALATTIIGQVRSQGIGAVKPHVQAIEAALKSAKSVFAKPVTDGGKIVVLTDGQTETLAALSTAAAKSADAIAIANPYPVLGLLLGSYYVETGKPREALRVLDAALLLSPLPKERLGATVPDLLSERAVALAGLKRWKDALASYDNVLRLPQVDNHMRGVAHRGRGFALVEMGRLDDAEAAYKASLKVDPGNKIALGELDYIAGLRKGKKPTGTLLTMPDAPKS